MKRIVMLALALLFPIASAVARADEPRFPTDEPIVAPPAPAAVPAPATSATAEGGPPTWRLPPCASPDADGTYRLSTGCSGVNGLRGATTGVRGTPAGSGVGLMFSSEGQELVRRGVFSSRGFHRLAIGGGGSGFEGALLGGVAGGFRIPVGQHHGPVVRAGALGATSGVVLAGRWRAGDAETRRLGRGFEVGTYVAVQVPWIRLGASAMRLPTTDALQSPVDVVEATFCAISAPIAICADGRAMRGDAFTAPGTASEVRAVYAGLTVGFTRER